MVFCCHSDHLYVEMACNEVFGAGKGGQIAAPDPDKTFKLAKAHIVTYDRNVASVITDLKVLLGMAKVGYERCNSD